MTADASLRIDYTGRRLTVGSGSEILEFDAFTEILEYFEPAEQHRIVGELDTLAAALTRFAGS